MRMLTHLPCKCHYPILTLDLDCRLQGDRAFARKDSTHSQSRQYCKFFLIFRVVCASLHVLRLRFITGVESVQSMGPGVLVMTQPHRLFLSMASPA